MVTRMKTTVEISDELLNEAKRVAAAEGITLRELMERGLRRELASRAGEDFTLIDAGVGGNGVQRGVVEGDWSQIRQMIYEGRGG